jgi:biopolymer transport protein ExbB/TolQ
MHVSIYFLAKSDFLFVVKNSTLEGKIIIVTLMIFSIFAWSVMASKAMQMRRAKKLNDLFETEFRTQKRVLDVFDRQVQVPDCPLFMVYHEGCRELDGRLKNPSKEMRRHFISLKSMESVKRSLERTVAQQSLKLESGLILLAIAVSGAPFLGLLGTVIGVMITFAAVAMAGDVNVNAIAPGIAASLLATVAGLAVAIPSLFGYNYILSRVKDAKDDMHIFIDEFVTRMAEFYREKAD